MAETIRVDRENLNWGADNMRKFYRDRIVFYFAVAKTPYCCGTYEIGNYGYSDGVVKADLSLAVKGEIKRMMAKRSRALGGLVITTLVKTELHYKLMAPILEELGFTSLGDFKNPNTRRTLVTYVKNLRPVTE